MRAIINGLDFLDHIGMENINAHVAYLTNHLLSTMSTLKWSDGFPKVRVYGPGKSLMRGGTVAFDMIRPDGMRFDARVVEKEASALGISIRTGCFCNPGAGEAATGHGQQLKVNTCVRRTWVTMLISSRHRTVSVLGSWGVRE